LGGKEINQVNVARDRDKGNNLILQISLEAAAPHCIVN
jgi:hypothetical protein